MRMQTIAVVVAVVVAEAGKHPYMNAICRKL
jgi:hypothetical protein